MTAPVTSDPRIDVVLLNPSCVHFFHTDGSALRVTIDDPACGPGRTVLRCQVACAFPWRFTDRWIGLRDEKDKDLGMLETTAGMSQESLATLKTELDRRYFIPTVTTVNKAKKEYETVTWDVQTDRGQRTYHVHQLRENVHQLDDGRIVITDRHGSRFAFATLVDADKESRVILERVLG